MAAASTSDNLRLKRLETAREKAVKLPRGTILGAKPMADLIAVRWPTLRDWCDEIDALETKGAMVRGGNGVDYEFKPLKAIDVLIKHFGARVAAQRQKNRKINRATGIQLSESDDDVSFQDARGQVGLTVTVVDYRIKQGNYTPKQNVVDLFSEYNQMVVNGILGIRTKMDPSGSREKYTKAELDDALRVLATNIHANAERLLKGKIGARLQQNGIAGTS